jgi:arginyl-tRNA synthetase
VVKEIIRQHISDSIRSLVEEGVFSSVEPPEIEVTRPKDDQFGEYTTNVALILGKVLGMNPRTVAEAIKEQITRDKGQAEAKLFEKIEVAGPGHINFFLSQSMLIGVLGRVLERGTDFGDAEIGEGTKVDNEIISANPTGPLHLGNARGGFSGDVISRVLRKAGYDVTNEYYVNDAGEQVVKLGHSVLKDSEAVYSGEYIEEIISNFQFPISNVSIREAGEKSAEYILEKYIKPTVMEKMGIPVDAWISEQRDVVAAGLVDEAIETLKAKGLTFESEGALWLRTTDFGDDKDRVLVKKDGSRTYFASDCGYILHKKNRGFARLILILGADHHGYRTRLQSAAKALGFDGSYDISFVQLVRLMKDGVEVRMSKRAGNVVTIDDLLERIPVDVVRFFFLMYSPDTHMNFDLGLAEERSAKNPVYYVQYAHARLSSILRKAEEAGISFDGHSREDGNPNLSLLAHPKERELLRELLSFPELIEEVAETHAVHRLPQYAIRLADKLHSFYGECKVIDPEQIELSRARLALVTGVKTVLGGTLGLMGVTAPERMEQTDSQQTITNN